MPFPRHRKHPKGKGGRSLNRYVVAQMRARSSPAAVLLVVAKGGGAYDPAA